MGRLASTIKNQKIIKINSGKILRKASHTLKELLNCGVINLDKPRRQRCRDTINDLKALFSFPKIGYAGTLDPNTTGVLPVLIGKATKLSNILSLSDKIYRGKFKLHAAVSRSKLEHEMKKFTGVIEQLPPKLSAVKRVLRKREVYWFKLRKFDGRIASFEMACQHGTYVRKVCHDLGEALGIGAHMFELERTVSGPFKLRKSISMEKVRKLANKQKYKKFIVGPEKAVDYIPKVWADDDAVITIIKGSPLFVPGVLRITSDFMPGKTTAIFGQDNKLKALGVAKLTTAQLKKQKRGIAVKVDLVLVQ